MFQKMNSYAWIALCTVAFFVQYLMRDVGLLKAAVLAAATGLLMLMVLFAYRGAKKIWAMLFKTPFEQKLNISADGTTELMKAAAGGDTEVLKNLLLQGKEINNINAEGATALMFAAEAGQSEAIELLLGGGALKDIKSSAGFTATQYATAYAGERHSKTAKTLKQWKTTGLEQTEAPIDLNGALVAAEDGTKSK